VCEFCDATAVREIEPDTGYWTAHRHGVVVLVAPYRNALVCALHEDLPIGACECPGRYGVAGVPCGTCGAVREHVGRPTPSLVRAVPGGW
jgi:hypothetical protein